MLLNKGNVAISCAGGVATAALITSCYVVPIPAPRGPIIGVAAPFDSKQDRIVVEGTHGEVGRFGPYPLMQGEQRFIGKHAGDGDWQVYLVPMQEGVAESRLFTSRDGDTYYATYRVPVHSKHWIDVRAAKGPWIITIESVNP